MKTYFLDAGLKHANDSLRKLHEGRLKATGILTALCESVLRSSLIREICDTIHGLHK